MENKKPTQFLMKPKVDFCFKELMEDEEVRNAFLAAVLGINLEEINESKILPSHLRQKDKDDKLGILNFIMFDDEEYYSRFHFWSDKGRKLYSDKFEIHTLELPKLAKHDYPETELLKWLQFINAETEEEFEMAAEKSEYIKKAYEDLNRISADEEKRLEYEERERAIRDHQYFSTVYKNTGLKEGRREGRQEGIQAVVELLQEMELEKEVICGKVQEKFHISAQEAAQEVEKYWKEGQWVTGDTFLNIHIKCSRLSYPTSSQIAGIELSEFPGNAETGQLCRRNFCRISVL